MSPLGCQKMSAKPCNRNAEESFPVLSLKSREQKPPNPLLIQDKDVLQPRLLLIAGWLPYLSEGALLYVSVNNSLYPIIIVSRECQLNSVFVLGWSSRSART